MPLTETVPTDRVDGRRELAVPTGRDERRASRGPRGRLHQVAQARELVVVTAMGVVSLLNYAYTLSLVWALAPRDYAVFGSVSALLLLCGTVSGAAVPWVLAREVARHRDEQAARRAAVSFSLFATVVEALIAAAATVAIASRYASVAALGAVAAAVIAIFAAAMAVGYLQGLERFGLISALRVAEVVMKIGAGLALVALGAGAGGAIAGFAVGAAVVAGVGTVFMAPDLRIVRSSFADRNLWISSVGVAGIQALAAVIAALDVVLGSLVIADRERFATYLVALILARIPVFIGAALSMVVFPRLVLTREDPGRVMGEALELFARVAIPVAMVTATLPGFIALKIFPADYAGVTRILPWASLGGIAMGAVNLVTTFFQARGTYRRATGLLGVAIVVTAALIVLTSRGGIEALAISVAAGGVLATGLLVRDGARRWPGMATGVPRATAVALVLVLPLVFLRSHPFFWLLYALVGGAVPATASLVRLRPDGDLGGGTGPASGAGRRPRVLHLGYEDPRRPGAGGGSRRTHEINRRLARDFDITVVCARYRGSRRRVEDGVRYVHVGAPLGYFGSLITYFACIPYALARHRSDLVVEDFGAPVSSVAVPWLTRRPVVGVVQWLFAKEKSRQYHLPFHVVERAGVASHRRLICVSEDLAGEVRRRNHRARVDVVLNGVDAPAVPAGAALRRSGTVFLGRLDVAHKGLDLMIEAFALVRRELDVDLVVGGDGPDRDVVARLAEQAGVAPHVHLIGRVPAEARFELLARADLVVMPSRYETFGMVAAEALAVGTPVLAFDIACLRGLVSGANGVLVPPFDVDGLAREWIALLRDGERRRRLGAAGPDSVAGLGWDRLAGQQGQVYREMVGLAPVSVEEARR